MTSFVESMELHLLTPPVIGLLLNNHFIKIELSRDLIYSNPRFAKMEKHFRDFYIK